MPAEDSEKEPVTTPQGNTVPVQRRNDAAERDWVVPAILVGIVAVFAIVIAVVFFVNASSSDDDSVAGQLEQWTSCLRSEDVNVPLVESLRDGGVRITIDGSLLEEGLELDAIRPALSECKSEAPQSVQRFIDLLDFLPLLPLGL